MRSKLLIVLLFTMVTAGAQAAIMNWGATVLADSTTNATFYPGYANPGTDVYLIYNGINNSDPTYAVWDDGTGNLVIEGGTLVVQYTTTEDDFWNYGGFFRTLNVPGLDWLGEVSADWDAMNDRVFTIVAISDDDGDTSNGFYYGIHTGNPSGFSNATAVNSIASFNPGVLDAGQSYGGNLAGTVLLTVASDHGNPTPSIGESWHDGGSTISCSVASPVTENGTNYVCTGWTGTGYVPATGSSNNTGAFTINGYSSITWHWAGEPADYWLDVTVVGSGSLNVVDGLQPGGTNLTLTATPNPGWLFMGWSGDLTGDYTQTNTTLLINGDKSITATFSNDADGDGLTNTEEGSLGTDPRDSDSDDDGLLDAFEVYIRNTDPLDADTDDDMLYDGLEVSLYETDPLDSDSDDDGLGDGSEVLTHNTNPLVTDTDGDGLSDGVEINVHSSDPLLTDTDGDSLSDYDEVITHNTNPSLADSDADGLNDYAELNTYLTDPNDADSDDDGLSDGMEISTHLTDPNDADSDDDGLSDGDEINTYSTNPNLGDTSGDGIMDGYAVLKGLDPIVDQTGIYAILIMNKVGFGDVTPDSDLYSYGTNLALEASGTQGMLFTSWSGSITGDYTTAITNIILNGHMDITATFSDDADGDGLLNTNETVLGTNPRSSDTDGDGLSDSEELYTYSTDPLVRDMDGDGLSDGEEILTYNTDPNAVDTDLDGFSDGYEVSTGYDPALGSSTPDAVISIHTAVEVHFNAATGSVYRIEGTDSLSNSWSTLETGISGNGGIIQRFYSTLDQSNRFFRAVHE